MFFTSRQKHVRNTCFLPGCCIKQVDYGTTAQHLQACNLFSRGLSEPVGLIDSLAAGGCLKHLFFSKSPQLVLQTLFFNRVEMFMPALTAQRTIRTRFWSYTVLPCNLQGTSKTSHLVALNLNLRFQLGFFD